MAYTTFSVKMCEYLISRQQEDLLTIFESFSDNITNPTNNTFFVQNAILDKMLGNLRQCKRKTISKKALYNGINSFELLAIEHLDLDDRLRCNTQYSKILGIEYFDEDRFMNVLDSEMNNISNKYNLNAGDDHLKLYNFLGSVFLSLKSSDDILISLVNQYEFFLQHSKYVDNDYQDEYITIYEEKIYKIDVLKQIINIYNQSLDEDEQVRVENNKSTKR